MLEKELLAFEELEEAAENLSLSSNCSVVQRLLGKRVHHSPKNGMPRIKFLILKIICFVALVKKI